MCQASGNKMKESRRGGFYSWQRWVNWQNVGCLFTTSDNYDRWTNMEDCSWKGNFRTLDSRESPTWKETKRDHVTLFLIFFKHLDSSLCPPNSFQELHNMFTCFFYSYRVCVQSCRHRHGPHIKDFLWRTKRTKSLWATIQRQEIQINWKETFSSVCSKALWEGRWTCNPF